MPYKSAKQRTYLHIHEPALAKKWDKEIGGKIKMKVNNKMRGALGRMDPKTNKIEINVKAHGKDKANLASTIKHELLHVKHPKMTEREVYKKSAKTKIDPYEQSKLLSKLRNKSIENKVTEFKKGFKMKGEVQAGDLITKMNEEKRLGVMGLV